MERPFLYWDGLQVDNLAAAPMIEAGKAVKTINFAYTLDKAANVTIFLFQPGNF